jgi:lipopolysaccharide biosynthesis glycosyltransferase
VLTVVTWLWRGASRNFKPKHADTLQRMVARNLTIPHRFVCITDEDGFQCETLKTPAGAAKWAKVPTPEGHGFPACYRRLWLFSEEAKNLGDRFLLLDLDCVVVGSLDAICSRPEPFVGWVPGESVWGGKHRYGGGMYLLTAGSHPEVYDDFKGQASIAEARKYFRGSDQAWLNFKLWGKTASMSHESGIHMFREFKATPEKVPAGAVIVQFSGPTKPWDVPKLGWVQEHWN